MHDRLNNQFIPDKSDKSKNKLKCLWNGYKVIPLSCVSVTF